MFKLISQIYKKVFLIQKGRELILMGLKNLVFGLLLLEEIR